MVQRIIVGLGAGLGAAVLFLVISKGTPLALALFLLAPLPIVIATLGFGWLVGLAAAALGTAVLAGITHPLLAFFFAIGVGLPACWLSFDAGRHGARWSVAWAAILAIAESFISIAVFSVRSGGSDAWLRELTDRLAPAAQRVLDQMPSDVLSQALADAGLAGSRTSDVAASIAQTLAPIMPSVMASLLVVYLVINLWLGARVVQISSRLPKSWTNVADAIRLPKVTALLLIVAIAIVFLTDGPAAIAANIVVGALSVAFALEGLAWLHVVTRGSSARAYVLIAAYLVTGLAPIVAALAGVIDSLWTVRGHRSLVSKT